MLVPPVFQSSPFSMFSQMQNQEVRSYDHWSFYVLAVSSAAGAATAIAAYILAIPTIAVAGGVLFVSNGLGSFYVKKFYTLNDLQDINDEMKEKNIQLKKDLAELRKERENLEEINKNFQKIPKDWQKTIKDGEMRINEQNKVIQGLTKELQKMAQTQEKQVEKVRTGLNEAKNYFAKEKGVMVSEFEKMKQIANELDVNVEEDKQNIEMYLHGGVILDEQTDEFGEYNDAFTQQVNLLRTLFQMLPKLFSGMQTKMQNVIQERQELEKKILPSAEKSTQELILVEKRLQERTIQLNKLEKKLAKYLDKIENVKKEKKGETK